ncbi:MAG: hypothetical protein JO148_00650 [Acidimicrobiia bacterium]|nr:hypothetical protein [Acidimicrobiia bacterium]
MNHALRLAVMLSDAHFEHRAVVVDDCTSDLQAEDFAPQDTVLYDRVSTGTSDQVGEGGDSGVERRLRSEVARFGRLQSGAVDAPHTRRLGERRRPPRQRSGHVAVIDDQMKVRERTTPGPQKRLPEGAFGFLIGEDPCRVAAHERGPARERFRLPVSVSPLALYEGAQLGLAKGLLPVADDYFFVPLRAP